MDEEEVLQEFVADIEPYIEAVTEGVRSAHDFAQANEDAKFAIDEMRDAATETGEALGHARDEALEAAEADHDLRDAALEAAEALGHLRDEADAAAAAVGAEGTASLGAGAASSAGILSSLSIPAVIALAAALALALAALFPVLAVLPLIGIGFTGLAAIAVPEISKVWTAISKGGAALQKLSPAERALVEPIRDLKGEFHQLASAVQPEILKAFGETIKILRDLMPAIKPLVMAAGQALDTFLGQIDHWLQSGSGQKFIQWMKVDGVGAIKAFGEFLWGLVSVLGRTFDFLFNFGETVHRVFDRVRHDVAAAFDETVHTIAAWAGNVRQWIGAALSWVEARFAPFTQFWHSHWTEIKDVAAVVWGVIKAVIFVAWTAIHAVLQAGLGVLENVWRLAWGIIRDTVVTVWDVIKAVVTTTIRVVLDVIGVALDLLTGHWSQAWADVKKLTSDALHGVISIILSLTSGFGHLLWDAGVNLVKGLIGGIESMVGAVGSAVSGIAHKVAGFFGLSPAKEGPLAAGGAPYIRGQHFGLDLIDGMRSVIPGIAAAAGAAAGAAGGHLAIPALGYGRPALAGAGAGGGGSGTVNISIPVTVNGWVGSDQQIAARIQDTLLEHGILNSTAGIWPLAKGPIR